MQYHMASARGVDPSQITRELSGERRSVLAPAEAWVEAMARHPKTSPEPWLGWMIARAGQVRMESWVGDIMTEYDRLCEAETAAQGEGDLAQLRFRSLRTREALDQVEEFLGRHVARGLRMLAVVPTVRARIA